MMEICTLDLHGFNPKVPVHRLGELAAAPGVLVWVDLIDTNANEMRAIAAQFSLPPLALEDALEPRQRPKLEHYDDHSFLVVYSHQGSMGDLAEIDLFVGHGWIVTVRNRNEVAAAWDNSRLRGRFNHKPPVALSIGLLGAALVAGIYGMNFKNMPETEWTVGYPLALATMLLLTVVLTAYFKKKRYL